MLEPFATIVVNSILSTRSSLGHPHFPLQSVAKTVVRPARRALAPDFFTPDPRSVKGKGKARVSSDQSNATKNDSISPRKIGAYSMKDSQSCLIKNRSLFVKETICRRFKPLRRHPSHHLPHSHLRRPLRDQIYLKTSSAIPQCRHTSTLADDPDPKIEDRSLLMMIDVIKTPINKIDPEKAWEAYSAVASSGSLSSLNKEQLLDFAEKIWAAVEAHDQPQQVDVDLMHTWGKRLMRLVDNIPFTTNVLQGEDGPMSHHDYRVRCLRAQAHAFLGNIDHPIILAHQLVQTKRFARLYAINKSVLNALRQRHDPIRTLEVLVTDYPVFERHIAHLPSIYATLASIPDPVSVLRAHSDWDEENTLRASELLIKSFCKYNHPELGLAILQELVQKRITVPGPIQSLLVRALGQAGRFAPANRLFATLTPKISRLDWLITGLHLYAQQGDIARAEACYSELKAKHKVSAASRAMRMYAYAVCGQTDATVSIFNKFFQPSSSPDNLALPKLAKPLHYEVLVLAHARAGDVSGVDEWLQAMIKAGHNPTLYVYNNILKCFAARGELEMVSSVLDQMRASGVPPDRVSYTTVITLLAHRQDPVSAEHVYKRAMEEGIVPDGQMITSLMNAHVEAGSWKGVVRAFDYLASAKIPQVRLTIETYNTLLKAYVLIGAPFKMVSRFFVRLEEMEMEPDEITFSYLIQSACDSTDMEAASDIFGELERRVAEGKGAKLKMTVYVLTIMISGYLRIRDHVRAKEFYDRMRRQGIRPTLVTFRTMLRAYEKDGSPESLAVAEGMIRSLLEDANRLSWDKPTSKRDSAMEHVYRPVMMAYARQARPEDVERLFKEIPNVGREPTIGLLTALLDAYRRSGDLDGVMKVWPQIFQVALRFSQGKYFFGRGKDQKRQPGCELELNRPRINTMCVALSIYIDALSQAGLHDQIGVTWAELQDHGFGFDAHNWNHLAIALIRAGDVERAFRIVERVLLPPRRRVVQIQEHRKMPDTPLSFEDAEEEDKEAQPISEPYEEALRRTSARARVVSHANRIAKAFSEETRRVIEEHEDDFAQGLHVLRQILPAWNAWSPHDRTLSALLSAVLRLQSGVPPSTGMESVKFDRGHGQDHNEGVDYQGSTDMLSRAAEEKQLASDQARGILGRIYRDYPQTTRIVLDFGRREKRRLRGGAFDKVYR